MGSSISFLLSRYFQKTFDLPLPSRNFWLRLWKNNFLLFSSHLQHFEQTSLSTCNSPIQFSSSGHCCWTVAGHLLAKNTPIPGAESSWDQYASGVCSGTVSVKHFIVRPWMKIRKKPEKKATKIFGQENEINYSSLSSIVQKHNTDLELQNGSISKILFHLQITMYENALRRLFLCLHLTSSRVYSQKTRNVSYSFRCPLCISGTTNLIPKILKSRHFLIQMFLYCRIGWTEISQVLPFHSRFWSTQDDCVIRSVFPLLLNIICFVIIILSVCNKCFWIFHYNNK